MITNAKKPKRRLSLQIIRVARELEALHILGEATIGTLQIAVGDLPPKPVCERTIRRDLEALEVAGLVTRRTVVCWIWVDGSKLKAKACIWRLCEPVALRNRLALVKGLTPKQIAILRDANRREARK